MDLTIQLKNNLISRITDSKDVEFLKALQTIFDASERSLFQLTNEQKSSILKGKSEICQNDFSENKLVFEEAREWLKKK